MVLWRSQVYGAREGDGYIYCMATKDVLVHMLDCRFSCTSANCHCPFLDRGTTRSVSRLHLRTVGTGNTAATIDIVILVLAIHFVHTNGTPIETRERSTLWFRIYGPRRDQQKMTIYPK